jgi:putative FmdB family regulatory protein
MPIYAYKCESCGHSKDVLQKMSDAPLRDCPACGTRDTFKKQLTAAGFQLKGSGWYVTDFRGGDKAKPETKTDGAADSKPAGSPATDSKPAEAAKPASAPATPAKTDGKASS